MISPILKFSIQTIIVGILFAIGGSYIFANYYINYYFEGFYPLVFFIATITIFVHYMLLKASEKRPAVFINTFLAFTGLKLLLYLFSILFYVFLIKTQPVSFLLTFLAAYFVFTIVEISAILNFFQKKEQ